ncbi:MAG TPA: hypothetical protein VF625_12615 [Longimicrobium sp.]|jgi:hypothetical protein
MRFLVTLLRELPERSPWAVQAHFRLADGSVWTWPVTVHPDHGAAEIVVESERDMLAVVEVRTLVAHYAEPPTREERQISTIRAE